MAKIDLMEAAAEESAILWRVQTILEALLPTGELDAWIHRVGLAGAIGELKSAVERMETVVNSVKGRAVGNKPLARSLARVKELMYDADDAVDELDYFRLQQQAEGVITVPTIELEGMVVDGAEQVDANNTGLMLAPASEPEGMAGDVNMHGAEQAGASANNTRRKNRSKAWDHFFRIKGDPTKAECIYCAAQIKVGDGTSGLHKHLKSCKKKCSGSAIEETPDRPSADDNLQNGVTVSANDSESRKRMRIEDSLATTTALWNKANLCKRIHEIAHELWKSRVSVTEYLNDSVASFDQYQSNSTSDTIVRTSGSRPGNVYGRYKDKDNIMRVIEAAKSDNITVLPIVGIVGVGKTTLAKLIYNDLHVKNQFERIWVWVSNIFDEVRVTREILDVVTLNSHEGSPCNRGSYEGVCNCTKLQEILKKHMACQTKKFLLVLDDVNDSMHGSQWEDLLDALGSSCTKGNVVIMTARNLSIAQRLGTVKPVKLGALEGNNLWLLFKACVIDDDNCKERLDIGRQISAKLKGNPLAVENAAEMLREQPTLDHWKTIIRNGVWKSLQLHGGIVNTLKISYYQLPYQLQQCFLFCSIFPNNHQFHVDDLVSMWISLGFVRSIKIGRDHFNALVNSCLLEQVKTEDPIPLTKQCYVMCGMMHEFARLISRTEFATIDGLECEEVLPTVRHVLIQTDSVNHVDECGTIVGIVNFQQKLRSIASSLRRLRTLILIGLGHYDHTFISSLVNCTYLRYLKLEYKGMRESLPIPLSKCYHLEMLDARGRAIVHDMTDLINMRHLVLTEKACGASSPAWSSCLQTIHLEDCKGWKILPSLESLSSLTKLRLRNMPEVTKLLIPSLEELVLIGMPKLDRCRFSSAVKDLNSSLRVLEIRRCRVLKAFPLFERCANFEIEQKSWLPNITELTVHGCPDLVVSNPLPPSSSFCKLSIKDVSTLPSMEGSPNGELEIGSFGDQSSIEFLNDNILSFHNLRAITRLEIVGCKNLLTILLQGFRQLVCLKSLEINYCTNFFSSDIPSTQAHEYMEAADFDALPSLECLRIDNCEITGEWLSVMLQHVPALEELDLRKCKQITWLLIEGGENSFPNLTLAPCASSQGNQDSAMTRSCLDKLLHVPSNLVPSLKKMSIENCDLKFQGDKEGLSRFTSLEKLRISRCPVLISSLVHGDETDDQANGRWLLPCSLGVLDIRDASLGTLQPCFPGDLTRLTVLEVWRINSLESLQLHSCTALEKLVIGKCKSLDALEGFQSLRSLRYLGVYGCPFLPQYLESLSTQGYELCPRLEKLWTDDPSFLTQPFCKHLTSLQFLQLGNDYGLMDTAGLTCEQEAVLQLLMSLQQLLFSWWHDLMDLPVGLHSLPSLKRLEIYHCWSISRLPERGLPSSLEELEVRECSEELTEQCRALATSKLRVIIGGQYVN